MSGGTLLVDLSSILILGSSWFTSTRKRRVGGLRDEKEGQSNHEKQPYKGCGDRFWTSWDTTHPQDAMLSLVLDTLNTFLVTRDHPSCNLGVACFSLPTRGVEILRAKEAAFTAVPPWWSVKDQGMPCAWGFGVFTSF